MKNRRIRFIWKDTKILLSEKSSNAILNIFYITITKILLAKNPRNRLHLKNDETPTQRKIVEFDLYRTIMNILLGGKIVEFDVILKNDGNPTWRKNRKIRLLIAISRKSHLVKTSRIRLDLKKNTRKSYLGKTRQSRFVFELSWKSPLVKNRWIRFHWKTDENPT